MTETATYTLRLPDGAEFGPGTIDLIAQWARQGRVPVDAVLAPTSGGPQVPVMDSPELAAILRAPPTVSTGPPVQPDTPMSGMIPYRNPAALIGYYLAVFSLIPFIGMLLGPPAVICGIVGFVKGRREPKAKGKVHAWVAIILGGLTTIAWWGLLLLAFLGNA